MRDFLADVLCDDLVFAGVWLSQSNDVDDEHVNEDCGEFTGVGANVSVVGDEVSGGLSTAVGDARCAVASAVAPKSTIDQSPPSGLSIECWSSGWSSGWTAGWTVTGSILRSTSAPVSSVSSKTSLEALDD